MGTVAKLETNVVSTPIVVKTETKTLPPAVTPITTGEPDVLLVGMEYIEEIKDEAGTTTNIVYVIIYSNKCTTFFICISSHKIALNCLVLSFMKIVDFIIYHNCQTTDCVS